jgi:L-alanine-DL-glutamate epimerase-like enolase superfamily enzyme
VRVRDGEGNVGAGYSGVGARLLDPAVALAAHLLSDSGTQLGALLGIERLEERLFGFASGGLSKLVANAISLAAWDLVGRREGVACADLWGRQPGADALPCYASGFFAEVATEDLEATAHEYRVQDIRLVKMRPTLSLADDLERLGRIQSVYNEPGTIAIDAFTSWDVRTARTFIEEARTRFLWVEDPVPYAVIGQLADLGAPIAAGETCESLTALTGLRHSGVRYLLPDLGRVGGPVRFLEAARALTASGAAVGGHVYPYYSAHLLACLPSPLPVELVTWEDPPFEAVPQARADGKLPVLGPGFGVTVRADALERHGERVAVV